MDYLQVDGIRSLLSCVHLNLPFLFLFLPFAKSGAAINGIEMPRRQDTWMQSGRWQWASPLGRGRRRQSGPPPSYLFRCASQVGWDCWPVLWTVIATCVALTFSDWLHGGWNQIMMVEVEEPWHHQYSKYGEKKIINVSHANESPIQVLFSND